MFNVWVDAIEVYVQRHASSPVDETLCRGVGQRYLLTSHGDLSEATGTSRRLPGLTCGHKR